MKSILNILIKQGLFERLYPKSCLVEVISSYSHILCIKERAMTATRPIAFICILMHKMLSGDCVALGCIDTPQDRLHTLKLKILNAFLPKIPNNWTLV